MKHNYSIEFLKNLILNEKSFNSEIVKSQGFIFYYLDKYKISIPKNLLLNNLNKYSIFYLLKNKDTLELSDSNINDILQSSAYLNSNENYEFSDLIKDIKNKNIKRLPFVNITFNDFINNIDDLLLLIVENKTESQHPILINFFSKITKEEFLQINEEYLIKYPSIFIMSSHLFIENDINLLFKKTILKNNKIEHKINDFKHYKFQLKDKKLFLKLLKNNNSDYNFISQQSNINKYLDNFISKDKFLLNYEIHSFIENITSSSLSVHDIQNYIFTHLNKKFSRNFIYFFKINPEIFQSIFDESFLEKIINTNNENIF